MMKYYRPKMSCGLRFLQQYNDLSPAQIIQTLKETKMMATYVIVQNRPKANSKRTTKTDKLIEYIEKHNLGTIIKSPEVYSEPGQHPKNWSQTYLWKVNHEVIKKFTPQ